ncbi:ParM/StbA family protein [Nostoc sp. MG11]|uniref:ParM/StbA family protein n=1 Tax=Nostoc sp. MG11 TaxID=2721166 RepID=UPI001869418F|nr:ParM/StbA family protein [Nostoc sp. MG11]
MSKITKNELPKLVISFDLGGSKSKTIAQLYPDSTPILIAMSPEIADVSASSIEHHFADKTLSPNTAWVGVNGKYYVLGDIARSVFMGTAALKELKYQHAVPKMLGMLWLAMCKFNLSGSEPFVAQLLLPPGESNDGQSLGAQLREALKQGINTPTGKLKPKLRHFFVSPEGSGIMDYREQSLGDLYAQKNVGMIMLGYRNASFLLSEKDYSGKAESTELGMSWMVQQFVERTAVGLSKDDLRIVPALVEASKGNFDELRALSRKSKEDAIQSDLKLFREVLPVVKDEYCRALLRWIRNIALLDEILICGGTATFVKKELTEHFNKEKIPVVWNGGVEIPSKIDDQGLGDRLADVWTSHQSYLKMLDKNFSYERNQPSVIVVPSTEARNDNDAWTRKGFLAMKEGA